MVLAAAVMSAVTQFVQPVVFGCYEEVPGQQGADAHQKEDDVHQIVRVLWTVAFGQRRRGMFGQEGRRVLVLLVLGVAVVVKSTRDIGGVDTGLYGLGAIHFHRLITERIDETKRRRSRR